MCEPAQELCVSNSLKEYRIYNIHGNGLGPRVFVSVNIYDESLIALADTGAEISVISLKALQKLGNVDIDENKLIIIKGIGQEKPFHSLGVVYLDLFIGSFKASRFLFHVIGNDCMSHEIILGADFLYDYYLAPSPAHGRLFYAPPGIEPEFVGASPHFSRPLCLSKKTKLESNSISFICISDVRVPGSVVYFEPCHEISDRSISFCRSIECINDENELWLEVVCYSGENVVLDKDTCVGKIWHIEEMACPEVEEEENPSMEVIKSMFKLDNTILNEDQQEKVYDMMLRNVTAISFDDNNIGRVESVSHDIIFKEPDQQPIKIPPRRIHGKIRDAVEEEVRRLYKDDLIEPSSSPW